MTAPSRRPAPRRRPGPRPRPAGRARRGRRVRPRRLARAPRPVAHPVRRAHLRPGGRRHGRVLPRDGAGLRRRARCSAGRFIRRFGARLILPVGGGADGGGPRSSRGSPAPGLVFALAGVVGEHRRVVGGRRDPGAGPGPLPARPRPRPQPAPRRVRRSARSWRRSCSRRWWALGVRLAVADDRERHRGGHRRAWAWRSRCRPTRSCTPRRRTSRPTGTAEAAVATRRLPLFLLVMAVSIVCYVAAEAGVSDWLVRYLEALPITQASLALTLFWAGIAVRAARLRPDRQPAGPPAERGRPRGRRRRRC